ncbi:MAG: efflux RND transporter periplasmic adaptor subunit [Steroidobacteraceae bacterium]|nr:efflux RND transporter periplasmic adaptor subunit [Steroidobacteraceae bacterium]
MNSAYGLVLATALAAVTFATGCAQQGEAAPNATQPAVEDGSSIPVEVVAPARRDMLATYTGTATLEAEADADIIAKVGGEVLSVLVEEGDRVKNNQLLARLDDRQLRLQAAQARATLAKAQRDYARQVELHDKGLVARGAFEGLKFDLDNLQAAHDLARLSLSHTEIRAPFAGIITQRHIRVGQTVQAGASMLRVTDPTPLKASVFVPERELARLQIGQRAGVQIDALAGKQFPATVTLVAPIVDAATATFKVTLEVDDAGGELKPGMFARVGIVFDRRTGALTIPRSALVENDDVRAVFVIEAGKARQRALTTGLTNGGDIEVLAGLSGGEQVVAVGQNGLKDGASVRIVSLESSASR